MIKRFADSDSVGLSDMTKQKKNTPEASVVDGIPYGRVSFPELLPHILEDSLKKKQITHV